MNLPMVVLIGRELLYTAVLLALPTVVTSLVVGLVFSVLQTITSVQEQTLSFAPRIIAVAIVIVLTLPWMLMVMTNFTERMFQLISLAID